MIHAGSHNTGFTIIHVQAYERYKSPGGSVLDVRVCRVSEQPKDAKTGRRLHVASEAACGFMWL